MMNIIYGYMCPKVGEASVIFLLYLIPPTFLLQQIKITEM